jgi:uncharacterized protein YneR
MIDFGNVFANTIDQQIFDALGDVVTVHHPVEGSVVIKASLTKARDAQGLDDQIDDYYPSMVIMDKDYYLFEDRTATIEYNGETRRVQSDEPYSKLNHKIIFKDDR